MDSEDRIERRTLCWISLEIALEKAFLVSAPSIIGLEGIGGRSTDQSELDKRMPIEIQEIPVQLDESCSLLRTFRQARSSIAEEIPNYG